MLLQAFAREVGAVLINVRGSTLFSKWVGESERLTSALFSLAAKFSAADLTTILFVDEVRTVLHCPATVLFVMAFFVFVAGNHMLSNSCIVQSCGCHPYQSQWCVTRRVSVERRRKVRARDGERNRLSKQIHSSRGQSQSNCDCCQARLLHPHTHTSSPHTV